MLSELRTILLLLLLLLLLLVLLLYPRATAHFLHVYLSYFTNPASWLPHWNKRLSWLIDCTITTLQICIVCQSRHQTSSFIRSHYLVLCSATVTWSACMWICQKPTIIDSSSSSSSDEDENTDAESESNDSESVGTAENCNEYRPNADEIATTGLPRPRDESPNSRKVAAILVCWLMMGLTWSWEKYVSNISKKWTYAGHLTKEVSNALDVQYAQTEMCLKLLVDEQK